MGRVEDVYAYLQGMAAGLSSSLMTAGARRVRDEALGDEQKRALDRVFAGATAAVLVEVARHDRGDRDLPERLEAEFGKFYRDPWVAETLVRFAISAEEPPLGGLRERYAAVGNDPGELPMDFGQAMRLLVYEIADRARKEASRAGSPLANLVLFPELGIIRAGVEEIARELRRAREAETGAGEEAGGRDGRFEGYERGPDGAEHRGTPRPLRRVLLALRPRGPVHARRGLARPGGAVPRDPARLARRPPPEQLRHPDRGRRPSR